MRLFAPECLICDNLSACLICDNSPPYAANINILANFFHNYDVEKVICDNSAECLICDYLTEPLICDNLSVC